MNINNIRTLLTDCYSKELCYPKLKDDWTEKNKCLGMCAITALIVNDYFGGEICKIHVDGISHYFNLITNEIIDLTSSQFEGDIKYNDYIIVDRKTILNDDTEKRHNLLKEKVISELLKQIDDKVYKCCSCKQLVEKFPNDQTVFIGKDNDILLVGEAPANNGWRKSHKLWCDINGKVLPSGVILQNYLILLIEIYLKLLF